MSMKNPLTIAGIEPEIFRFAARTITTELPRSPGGTVTAEIR